MGAVSLYWFQLACGCWRRSTRSPAGISSSFGAAILLMNRFHSRCIGECLMMSCRLLALQVGIVNLAGALSMLLALRQDSTRKAE